RRDARDGEQLPADLPDRGHKFVIARTEVAQHRLLDRHTGRERAGRKQRLILGTRKFFHDRFASINEPAYQGSEKVLTLVMNFMASITPSLIPKPESLTPPNGEHSIR